MPNADIHVPIGVASGGVAAIATLPSGASAYQGLIEILGGLVGGLIGAKLPDIFDPATSPNHRGVGHGLANALAAGKIYLSKLPAWQSELREAAKRYGSMASAEPEGFKRGLYWAQSTLCLIAAGLLAGLIVGYASHLVLDFTTPKGLPLVCRAF